MKQVVIGAIVLSGIVIAVAPLLVSVPDDDSFFHILRHEENMRSDWTHLNGTLSVKGVAYTYSAEKTRQVNDQGSITHHEEVLTAKDSLSQTVKYRRLRYFNEYGSGSENIEESPTRTVKRGRGPTGNDAYSEQILVDNSPLFARKSVRWIAHGAGALMVLLGLASFAVSRRISDEMPAS